jgi:hypothetical protein
LVITLQFWREEHVNKHPEHASKVFVVEIATTEFVGILENLVAVLDGGQNPG